MYDTVDDFEKGRKLKQASKQASKPLRKRHARAFSVSV